MAEYNLNLNIKIDAADLVAAYAEVSEILGSIKGLGTITKVDLQEPKHGNTFHGHTAGCRMSDGRRSGTCTCGPVPR